MSDQRPSEIFAANLRDARHAAGLSQEALSKLTWERGWHLHATAITRIEKGGRNVSLDDAVVLTQALGMRLDGFVISTRLRCSCCPVHGPYEAEAPDG